MTKAVAIQKVPAPLTVAPIISYQPNGVRQRGRGVAYEWPLPVVLKFVEKGIQLKRDQHAPPSNKYIVAYDRVGIRTLEMVHRWLLKAERSGLPVIEVPSRGTPNERLDLGGYVTVAAWFGRFIHDGLYRSVYCPRCRKSYLKAKLRFVILGPCPSGRLGQTRHARAPMGESCPKGHLLIRD